MSGAEDEPRDPWATWRPAPTGEPATTRQPEQPPTPPRWSLPGSGDPDAVDGDGGAPVPATAPGPEPVATKRLVAAAGAGLVAALAGAVVWGLIVRSSDYEVGIIATAIGLAVGIAVRAVAGRGGPVVEVIAVLSALVGILVGKYLAFAWELSDQLGDFAPSLFSSEMFRLFREARAELFTRYDLLWLGLALVTAFVVTRATTETAEPAAAQGEGATAAPRPHSRNPIDRLTVGLPQWLRVTIDWLVTIVGAVAIVLLVKAYVVNPYRIPSSSMEPTLHCAQPASGCEANISDRVLANRFIYHLRDPSRGDIVVFETPPEARVRCGAGGTFVKRLIGLPGETVEVRLERGLGYVYINGRKLNEPYVESDRRVTSTSFGPTTIPPNSYFMMGDNRSSSCDSRQWGSVPRGNLIGKVFATYWPPKRIELH